MIPDPKALPTSVAHVIRRLRLEGVDNGSDSFLHASYVAEAALKLVVVSFHAALSANDEERAYEIGYRLIRANGLGQWEQALRRVTSLPHVGSLPRSTNQLTEWVTKRRSRQGSGWFSDALNSLVSVVDCIGDVGLSLPQNPSVEDLVHGLVLIRNKTKAHGAYGADFFARVNTSYINAVSEFVESCPLFQAQWIYRRPDHRRNDKGVYVALEGLSPRIDESIEPEGELTSSGVYVVVDKDRRPFQVAALYDKSTKSKWLCLVNRELDHFWLPNGGYTNSGKAEFLDYGKGHRTKLKDDYYTEPPAPLPSSRTEGRERLEIQGEAFANLPSLSDEYVRRPTLENTLQERLLDRNHPIITLHGRGGIGKTSVALYVAHDLVHKDDPRFDIVVWFSARDIELTESGPHRVSPSVQSLSDVVGRFSGLVEFEVDTKEFAGVLQDPTILTEKGFLLIFDNFETFDDTRGIHRFLDTHTHLPNKVLITSRERAFKADYPIEVKGMEWNEAEELMRSASRRLGVEGLLDDDKMEKMYDYAEGHAYVMRILIGEMAKERRFVPAAQIVSEREDIVDAVFERSFRKLSYSGKWVFLTVANWRSAIAQLALIVVLSKRAVDVERGIDECTRLALLVENELGDGHPCYFAPELARTFGAKKLQGSPDRLAIEEDLGILQRFGVISGDRTVQTVKEEPIEQFTEWCKNQVEEADEEKVKELDGLLEKVAELWPPTWLELARFRMRAEVDEAEIGYALRRAVEENPYDSEAWILRAEYSDRRDDEETYISSLVSAVDAEPDNVLLVSKVARELTEYVTEHKDEIPEGRRGVYVASVRDHMTSLASNGELDADQLSQLAWLYLIEDKEDDARVFARRGLELDGYNSHCRNILERVGQ